MQRHFPQMLKSGVSWRFSSRERLGFERGARDFSQVSPNTGRPPRGIPVKWFGFISGLFDSALPYVFPFWRINNNLLSVKLIWKILFDEDKLCIFMAFIALLINSLWILIFNFLMSYYFLKIYIYILKTLKYTDKCVYKMWLSFVIWRFGLKVFLKKGFLRTTNIYFYYIDCNIIKNNFYSINSFSSCSFVKYWFCQFLMLLVNSFYTR